MDSKRVKLTTERFEKSSYAKKAPITVECPYCGSRFEIFMDIETAQNKKRMAITWKCPKCSQYCKLWDCALHRLEEK